MKAGKLGMEVNAQCKQILEGIERLEEYLQERIAKEALDLDSNFETNRNQELLLRLKKSLLQYTERGKNLVYVGLMGHFSTGKSSTINSLLELDETFEEVRKVGLNPVDKSITLITHSDNKDSILTTTREGLVSIRASFIDSEFLRNIVLADTPGTGDPLLASEIAKDFLPICDLIIYFFSAAIPLDSADVPLLTEKYSHLAFIPIRFVITRADEFKHTDETPFSYENFNKIKADSFLNELTQRINHLFKNSSYVDHQSINLIDNKSKFNIEQLRQNILDFANISDVQSQINIHSHKIIYFKSSAERLQSFFCNFLLEKLGFLSNVIKTSEKNIDRFQGKIRLTNNTLTESWNKEISSINEIKQKTYKQLLDVPAIPSSINLLCSQNKKVNQPDYFSGQNGLEYYIRQEVNERIKLIKSRIERNITPQFKNDVSANKGRIDNLLSLNSLSSAEVLELGFSPFQRDKLFVDVDFLPSEILFHKALNYCQEIDNQLTQYHRELEAAIEKFKKLLNEQHPLKEYESLLKSAINDLTKDFDNYFDSITVYRSGVFALNVKEAISKLGLGHRMDELESDELTEEQKAIIKQDAQEHIFPDVSRSFINASKNFVDLQASSEELQGKIKVMSSEKSALLDSSLEDWKKSQIAIIKDDLARKVESDVNRLQQIVNTRIRELFTTFDDEWKKEVSRMQAERRKRFAILTISFGVIGLVLYLLYIFGAPRNLPNNLFVTIVLGVIVNLVSNVVGFIWATVTDKFPINIKAKESNILGRLREDYFKIINNSIAGVHDSINPDSQILYEFWKNLLITEPLKAWSIKRESFYKNLITYAEEYSKLRQKYVQIVNDTAEGASKYFSDTEYNLQKLNEFSDNLQQTAIKPSFELLAETKANLDTVIQNIQEIDFA